MMLLGKEKVPPPLGQWRKKKKKKATFQCTLQTLLLSIKNWRSRHSNDKERNAALISILPYKSFADTHKHLLWKSKHTLSSGYHTMQRCSLKCILTRNAMCRPQHWSFSSSLTWLQYAEPLYQSKQPRDVKNIWTLFPQHISKDCQSPEKKKPTRPPITVKAAPKSIWVLQSHTLLVWPVLNATAAEPNHQRHTDTHESSPGNFNQERSSPTALRGRVI